MKAKKSKANKISKANASMSLSEPTEKKIKSNRKVNKKLAGKDLEHELPVREIELEMQNEELLSTQSKLVSSLKEYTQLFEYAPAGYFILDEKGVIEKVNHRGSEQIGLAKNLLVGKSFSVFLNGEFHQNNFYKHRNIVFETDQLHRIECEIKKINGTVFPALIKSRKVRDEKNNFKHFLTMLSDISDFKEHEKKMEQALEKEKELNELKSRFISIASHEFRTPLSSILSSLSLLEQYMEPVPADKKQKHIERIKTSIWDLTVILDDFLSLERLETGKISIEQTKFNLQEFINKFIEDTNNILKKNQIIQYAHSGKKEIVSDQKILKHILLNLVSNASKYSDEKSKIKISTEIFSDHVLIKISDHGIGIPIEDQPFLFKRFYRAHNATNIQGTGLGLNIVKRYVELLNGNINFKSTFNKGTTFYLNFPLTI